jgi:hypothetical protein
MGEGISARRMSDVRGTLFDLAAVRAHAAPPLALEAWFARLLHAATAMTLAGEFRPSGRFGPVGAGTVLPAPSC